jgi:uncharacterized protein (TIGR03083 family)
MLRVARGLWQAIDDQRTALADLLAQLTPDEWDHPSLCAGWTIRDVTGHLILQTSPTEMLRLARHAFTDVNAAIHQSAIRLAQRHTPATLTTAVRGLTGTRRRIPYPTPRSALVDILVHSLDISVPLNRSLPTPPAITATAATEVTKRLPGLWPRPTHTLRATDTAWQHGEGPLIEAPIATLLLILTARQDPSR